MTDAINADIAEPYASMEVVSDARRGTLFSFHLPLDRPETPATQPANS